MKKLNQNIDKKQMSIIGLLLLFGMWAIAQTGNTNCGNATLSFNSTGSYNSAYGFSALHLNTTGGNNTANGNGALHSNTTGSNNTALGNAADVSTGDLTNATAIGYNAKVTASNTIQLGNDAVTKIVAGAGTNTTFFAGKCVLGNVTTPISTPQGYSLYVKDGILSERVKVAVSSTGAWADYVFANDYQLKPLQEVEAFVKTNKHLPGVPSAEQMVKSGNDLGTTDAKLLEKIEELTLYMIELNKYTVELNNEVTKLNKKVTNLETENTSLKCTLSNIKN